MGSVPHMKRLILQLPDPVFERLRALKIRYGESVGSIVRGYIRAGLALEAPGAALPAVPEPEDEPR